MFQWPQFTALTNVMYTATEDLMTVVTVGRCLKVAMIWSFMFILTLVQSHTHVDTVQIVLDKLVISRHICWSHMIKVLGSHATLVRRNSASRVILRSIYFVMKVWSHMFVMNVWRVSVQHLKWNSISWNTQTLNGFAVVHVVNILNTNTMLWVTSTDALLNWDMSISLPGKIETENKQSWTTAYWTDLLLWTQDLSVRFCVQQIVSCYFSTLRQLAGFLQVRKAGKCRGIFVIRENIIF